MHHWNIALSFLADQPLYDKMSKCEFGTMDIMYLVHMIGKDDVKVHMKRILTTLDWSIPKNLNELGESNFHTTMYIAIGKSIFKAWYFYGVPNHLDHNFGGCRVQEV